MDNGGGKKAKVLILLTYYHPYWTGLTLYAKTLAEGLVKEGYEVRVLTTRHLSSLPAEEIINGVRVIRKNVWFRFSRTMISGALAVALGKEIAKTDKVVVFIPYAELAAVTALTRLFKKELVLVHNGDLELPEGRVNDILEKIYDLSTKTAIETSKAIVIHTKDYARNSRILAGYEKKWEVITTPVEKMEKNKMAERRIRNKTGRKQGPVVGFAGRWVEEKGFDILLKAVPMVAEKMPNVRFVFAGEEKVAYENFFEKNALLLERAGKRIISLGLLSRKEMPGFYRVCDVFVISSRTDCFPTTQIEAMMCGTPVVVTDIPGARWPVKQTGMGVVVEKENPGALAEGIVRVLKNRNAFVKGQKMIAKFYWDEPPIKKYIRLLER